MDNPFQFFTFLVFIFMVFKLCLKPKPKDSHKNLPQAPWKLPLIGHMHLFLFSLPHHLLRELAKKHGPLMQLKLGELSAIVVSSPEAAKEVMKAHDINFSNRPFLLLARIMLYNFTDIAYAPYGDYWRQLRKICTLELLSTKRVQSFQLIREQHVSNLCRSISSNEGLPINLGEMLCNLSYSITLSTAVGRTCKKPEEFISLVSKISEEASGFGVSDLFPSIKLFRVISGKKAEIERLHQLADEVLENIIQEHRASNKNLKDDEDVIKDDLVDVLLNLQVHGGLEFPLTDDNIKAVIQDILLAGTETSSTTVEWTMSELMRNPRVLQKVQTEVRQVFDKTGGVKESNLQELNYLKLVIKETLRLHPPLPLLLPRESVDRCEINGYEIPSKSKVIVNAWAIGRDPKYWDEAESFNPERFMDSSIDYKGTNYEFIPFGAGRRICPGISFGLAIVELALARLLYHFDWKLPNRMKHEDLDMSEAFGSSVRRKNNLYLIPIPYHAPCVQ
ncbi:hypothetical protein PTKIN_Ptkin11bG0195800 [Pterospermum kingtungense]